MTNMLFLLKLVILLLLSSFFSWSVLLIDYSLAKKSKKTNRFLRELVLLLLLVAPESALAFFLVSLFGGEAVLGMVMGSFLLILLLVPGLLAIIRGSLLIGGKILYKDAFLGFLFVSLPLLFLLDKQLSSSEGWVLMGVGLALLIFHFGNRLTRFKVKIPKANWGLMILGGGFFVLSFCLIISLVASIDIKVSPFLQGLFLFSLPVCLSEIVLSLFRRSKKQKTKIVFDHLFFSLAFSATFILGLTAILFPFRVSSLTSYLWSTIFFLIGFALFYFFAWSKKRIDRREGVLLIFVFLLMIVMEMLVGGF